MHRRTKQEIDIEILGKYVGGVWINYWSPNDHGCFLRLNQRQMPGFDAAQIHKYAFVWSRSQIDWYVDDQRVHCEDGSRGPMPSVPGKLMFNLWGVDHSFSNWAGPFSYWGPQASQVEWFDYTAP